MPAKTTQVGIKHQLVHIARADIHRISKWRFANREVENKNQVRAFGDEDFFRMIDVQTPRGRGLE